MKYITFILSTLLFMACSTSHLHNVELYIPSTLTNGSTFFEYEGIGVLNDYPDIVAVGFIYTFYEKDKRDTNKYTLISKDPMQSVVKVYRDTITKEFIDLKIIAVNEGERGFYGDDTPPFNLFINKKKHKIVDDKVNHIYLNKDSLFSNKVSLIVDLNIEGNYKQIIKIDRTVNKILYLNAYNDEAPQTTVIYRVNNNTLMFDNKYKVKIKKRKIKNLDERIIMGE